MSSKYKENVNVFVFVSNDFMLFEAILILRGLNDLSGHEILINGSMWVNFPRHVA